MNDKLKRNILFFSILVTGTYLFFAGLIHARPFLIPFAFALIFSMILVPVENKLIFLGIPKVLSVIIADLLLMVFCLGMVFIIGLQVQNVSGDFPEYKDRLQPKIEKAQEFIESNTGLPKEKQQEILERLKNHSAPGGTGGDRFYSRLLSLPGNFLLVFVYIFFLMFYRRKFKLSVLNFFAREKRENVSAILSDMVHIVQKYLFGRFILVLILAILYMAGLGIIGLKHVILISLVSALLSLIPYIGNVIAVIMTILISLMIQNSLGTIAGILIVFSVSQFIESYILEPYLVGHQVELNPAITLIGVIIGGFVWGLAGMILFIPLMGFFKVMFDHVSILHPFGYIFDEQDTGSQTSCLKQIRDAIKAKIKK